MAGDKEEFMKLAVQRSEGWLPIPRPQLIYVGLGVTDRVN